MAREGGEWNIYYIHPLLVENGDHWGGHFARIRDLGFGAACIGPIYAAGLDGDLFLTSDFDQTDTRIFAGAVDATAEKLADLCSNSDLRLILDVQLNCVAADGVVAREYPQLFFRSSSRDIVDPRHSLLPPNAFPARFGDAERELVEFFASRLVRIVKAGVSGFRLVGLDGVPARFLSALIQAVRSEVEACQFLGWTPGLHWSTLAEMESVGFDAAFASTPWWDGRRPWLIDEYNILRRVAPRVIGMPEAPYEERLAAKAPASKDSYRHALRDRGRDWGWLARTHGLRVRCALTHEFQGRVAEYRILSRRKLPSISPTRSSPRMNWLASCLPAARTVRCARSPARGSCLRQF